MSSVFRLLLFWIPSYAEKPPAAGFLYLTLLRRWSCALAKQPCPFARIHEAKSPFWYHPDSLSAYWQELMKSRALEETLGEFVKSGRYAQLPTEAEKLEAEKVFKSIICSGISTWFSLYAAWALARFTFRASGVVSASASVILCSCKIGRKGSWRSKSCRTWNRSFRRNYGWYRSQ